MGTNKINSGFEYLLCEETHANEKFDLLYSFTYIMTDIHSIALKRWCSYE